jgi:hypothetical protein
MLAVHIEALWHSPKYFFELCLCQSPNNKLRADRIQLKSGVGIPEMNQKMSQEPGIKKATVINQIVVKK